MHKSDDSGSYPDQKAKLLSVSCYAPRILLLCDFVRNGSMLLCARGEWSSIFHFESIPRNAEQQNDRMICRNV